MFDWALSAIQKAEVIVQAAVALIGLGIVAHTYVKTKAVVPTVGALLFLFFVVWSLNNTSWFDEKIGEEFRNPTPSGVVTRTP